MLVLARKSGQSVSLFHDGQFIGRVTVDMTRLKTSLGFEFVPNVRIVRDEVLDTERMKKDVKVSALV
jgi:hypothetical protein